MSLPNELPPVVQDEPIGLDFINNLNADCLGRIFQFLPLVDRFRITAVCKNWNELSDLAWEKTKCLSFNPYHSSSMLGEIPVKARTAEVIGKVLEKSGPQLKRLSLRGFELLLPIAREYCQNLTHLDIVCDYEEWRLVNGLFPKLQCLRMTGWVRGGRRVPEEFFQALPRDTLVEIELYFSGRGNDMMGILPGVAATILQNCQKLEGVTLESFFLNPEIMSVIFQKSTLKDLNLENCSLRGPLPHFASLTSLTELNLGDIEGVNDHHLLEISDTCKQLNYLSFEPAKVTDRGIMHLRALTKLRTLLIYNQSPVNSAITDVPLSMFHSLKKLTCEGCLRVRDGGIITLISYASDLMEVGMQWTGVTIKLLNEANEIMKHRTSNVKLKITVDDSFKDEWVVDEKSPLLEVEFLEG